MIAKYIDTHYLFLQRADNTSELITYNQSKAIKGFEKSNDIFYKPVELSDNNLNEIFDITAVVFYDTELNDVPTEWILSLNNDISNSGFLLRFAKGILPGWNIEEKNVCTLEIGAESIKNARLIYKYIKKNGECLKQPLIEEKTVTADELIKIASYFKNRNL